VATGTHWRWLIPFEQKIQEKLKKLSPGCPSLFAITTEGDGKTSDHTAFELLCQDKLIQF